MNSLHNSLMKFHSSLYDDSVLILNPITKKFMKISCRKSKFKNAFVKGYSEHSLVIKIFKDDLFNLKLPLRGYEQSELIYDSIRYMVKDEVESNGSTKDMIILTIDRVS